MSDYEPQNDLAELLRNERESDWPSLRSSGKYVRRHALNRRLRRQVAPTVLTVAVVAGIITSLLIPRNRSGEPIKATPRNGAAVLAGRHSSTRKINGSTSAGPAETAGMVAQEPYMALSEQVYRLSASVSSHPLSGTAFDVDSKSFTVYWADDDTAVLAPVIAAAALGNISVKTVRSLFSLETLTTAAGKISADPSASAAKITIDFPQDGSHLVVSGVHLGDAAQGKITSTKPQAALLSVLGKIETTTGIPITVENYVTNGNTLGKPKHP